MKITDMILEVGNLSTPSGLPDVQLIAQTPETRDGVLAFVEEQFSKFSQYYMAPPPTTTVYAIVHENTMIGTVLVEERPTAAVLDTDSAIACVVVDRSLNGQGFGSAAIVESCSELARRGFERVIAEWVASVSLYERLGFSSLADKREFIVD